jgi:SAM-dependent methyltransferase
MNNSAAHIVSAITLCDETKHRLVALEWQRTHERIPGWSNSSHALFFHSVISVIGRQAQPLRALVCGVYHGLDLALLQWAARSKNIKLDLVGVDLFSDQPCADWDEGQRARGTWEANGFGPPPSMEAAQRNAPGAQLVRANSIEYMRASPLLFDFIYLDTSHDYATVRAELAEARRILAPGGVLAGDDYFEPGSGWGVDRAVCELVPHHVALWGRIWLAT